MSAKITICLPTLNAAAYLDDALESVCAQRYPDWELCILDGGSTDETLEIAENHARHETRIHISKSKARGIYGALNEIIRSSSSDYITFLMADDIMHPVMLQRCIPLMEAHQECGIVQTGLKRIDAEGTMLEDPPTVLECFLKDRSHCTRIHRAPLDAVLSSALRTLAISLTQLLVRRTVFVEHGMFREDLGPEADFEWNTRVRFFSNVLHLPDKLAFWRVHAAQATAFHGTKENYMKFFTMYRLAMTAGLPVLPAPLQGRPLTFPYWAETFQSAWNESGSLSGKVGLLFNRGLREPLFTVRAMYRRLMKVYSWSSWLEHAIERGNLNQSITPLAELDNR